MGTIEALTGLMAEFAAVDHFHAMLLVCMQALLIVGLALVLVMYALKKRG